ncbi:hypothetical protein ABI59_18035 [Acidobacteria bacterium Mor1]|nr:hypothetical protein ABI59_18035 [Acidobacteria bacterium Mor1]
MARDTNPFGPGALRFLRELEANNNKPWFEDNKERYETEIREPALQLIRLIGARLSKISPHLVAADRKVGGSLMRVYRDVRFSKDKTPYKTNVGIQFRHEAGKDVHAPGLYVHIADSGVFLGAGMWRPAKEALAGMREAIDLDAKNWKKARDGKRFREHWDLSGDSLKRPPRGYDADHPMIEDLRRTDHIAVSNLSKKDVSSSGFVDLLLERFGRTKSYMAFQAEALGLPF